MADGVRFLAVLDTHDDSNGQTRWFLAEKRSAMITLQPEEFYFGVIDGEMVNFTVNTDGDLHIMTLTGKHVFVRKGKWKQKGTLFGPGKITCALSYKGQTVEWQIRIYPLSERAHQENMWLSGRNGTFNLPTRPFSSRFDVNDDAVWEDEP